MKFFRIEPADTTLIPEASRGTYSTVENVSPGVYLFDLARDPAEKHNLAWADSAATERFLVRLAAQFTRHEIPTEQVEVTEEMRRKLRSLGYIR